MVASCPSGSTDSMHVGFGVARKVIVDHFVHPRKVIPWDSEGGAGVALWVEIDDEGTKTPHGEGCGNVDC